MKNITIDFISSSVSIDGEKIENVTEVMLEIKRENETFRFQKAIQKEQKKENEQKIIEFVKPNKNPNWRTIPQAVKQLKEEDEQTSITESMIRKMAAEGKIAFNADEKLVDLNEIKRYFGKKALGNFKTKMKQIY